MIDVILTANSPGEILGWVLPVMSALTERELDLRIFLVLLPCPYATGKEAEIAAGVKGIAKVVRPFEYLRYLLFGIRPHGLAFSKRGVILHLGGDILHAALLARRLRFPAFAYGWGNRRWDGSFRAYFVSDARQRDVLVRRGIEMKKVTVVGNLLADAVAPVDGGEPSGSARLSICFLPGSRQREVHFLAPFFLAVAELMAARRPDLEFRMPLSPFVDVDEVALAVRKKPWPGFDGSAGKIAEAGDGWEIRTERGVTVRMMRGHQYEVMKRSDLVVSIPGTKCGEAGCLARPMVVILPFNKPEELPSIGVVGWLRWLPGLGPILKRIIMARRLRTWNAFVAQPNILAGREVVPEVKGIITAAQVADAALDLLDRPDRRAAISRELEELYAGGRGAARRLVAGMFDLAGLQAARFEIERREVPSGYAR